MVHFRPASESDLLQVHKVFYENEVRDMADPPLPGGISSDLQHSLQTGTMQVAEENGQVLAYGAAITRGRIRYLTDLFVRPDQQSAHLGKQMLERVLPHNEGEIRCTLSSTDPRAQALYIRSGMQPQWPHYNLRWQRPARSNLPTIDIEIVEGRDDVAEFVHWDAQVCGRSRPMEHTYWVEQQQAVPLWFRRRGVTIGYGYVRLGAGTLWFPHACTIGPIGARNPEDASACVLAAVGWAQGRADVLRIDVPGPHPCLAALLAAHFRIVYVETFVSTAITPFFDARCYIASGANLL